jgi:hypothetical protein
VVADALVDVQEPPPLPYSIGPESWDALDALTRSGDYWEMLMPASSPNPVRCWPSWRGSCASKGATIRCCWCGS